MRHRMRDGEDFVEVWDGVQRGAPPPAKVVHHVVKSNAVLLAVASLVVHCSRVQSLIEFAATSHNGSHEQRPRRLVPNGGPCSRTRPPSPA